MKRSFLLPSLLASFGVAALLANAQTVLPELTFKDTFGVSAATIDLDFENAIRQSGNAAPLVYTRNPVDGDRIQLGAEDAPGQLRLLSDSYVSPNHNFIEGGAFTIEFDVNPGMDDPDNASGDWCAVVFGSTTQNPFVNASDGVGILFRNTGDIQVFDGATATYGGGGEFPGGIPKGLFHVKIEVDTANFRGGSPATVRMFIDGTQVKIGPAESKELVKANGFTANFITLESLGFPGPWTHVFDNLAVTATPCIGMSPTTVEKLAGQTSDPITVRIPTQLNASQAAVVTVRSLNKSIAVPVGADADGALKLTFPAAGATTQTFTISAVGPGITTITAQGPEGVCVDSTVQVNVAAGVGLAEVLFQDNFNTSAGNLDVNFEQAAGRQGGSSVGTLSYVEPATTSAGGTADDLTQLTGTELSLAPYPGVADSVSVTPNHNFTEGGEFTVEFAVDPGTNDPDGTSEDWAAVVVGSSSRNAYVNASDGIGILFRNQGNIQVFDGATSIYGGDGGFEGGLPRGKFQVKIAVKTFGFAGTPATVSMWIDGVPARISGAGDGLQYVKSAGLRGNYITLLAYGAAGNYWTHAFDDLKVSALACVTAGPASVYTTAGDSDKTITVFIPTAMNTGKAATVTLTSVDPQVAIPVGALAGRLTLTFAAGAARSQTVAVQGLTAGETQFIISNDSGVCTSDPLLISVAPAAPAVLCDDFNTGSIKDVLRIDLSAFETGAVDGAPVVNAGQVEFSLTASANYWGGSSVATEQTFSATTNAPLTLEIDRVAHTGAGTATRSAVWITDQIRSRYILFADNQGEGGWHYNQKVGLTNDAPIGGGANMAAFDGMPWDDGGQHRIKLVANGETARFFLDGVLGAEVPFPVASGIVFEFGAYTRAAGDSVTATFDNLCIYSALEASIPCVVATPLAISGVVGATNTLTVTVPKLLNQAKATSVMLVSADPTVAALIGAVDGQVKLDFPAGDITPRTVDVVLGRHGHTSITLTNSDSACIFSDVTVDARSSFLLNPSFEENYPATFPHYGAADGWTCLNTGVNKSDGPFHDNGVVPDRGQMLLMQNAASAVQRLAGLVPGKQYWLQFRYNARNCCGGTISLTVRFNGEDLGSISEVTPVGGSNPYNSMNIAFTPSVDSGDLEFSTANSGDATVLLDAITVVQRDANSVLIRNPSFEASGLPAWPGYIQPSRMEGWEGTGSYGVNFSGAGPFADNGDAPDQDLVALVQGQGSSLTQIIAGLTSGQNYTLTFAVNGRGGNTPRLKVSFADQALIDEDVLPVGAANPYLMKSVVFTPSAAQGALRFEQTAAGDNTILLDNVVLVPGGTVQEKVPLKVSLTGATGVRVSWPTSASGYSLQATTALPGGWQNSTAPTSVEGSENAVYVQPAGTAQFFRLRK